MTRALFLAALTLIACNARKQSPLGATRNIVDDLQRPLAVKAHIDRVVSLAPSSTEILYALGLGDRVVGVDNFSSWPEATKKLPHLGSNLSPSLESIAALRPDLVFTATSANNQQTADALQRLGIPVFVSRSDSLADVDTDIMTIARAMDVQAAGARVDADLKAELAAVAARVAGTPSVRVAVVVWPEPLIIAGGHSHVGELLRIANGRNIADSDAQPFPNFSFERLIAARVDVLIVGSHSQKSGAPEIGSLATIDAIPAVHNHRVHTIDGDLLFRPGPRLGIAARELAKLFHPEQFADGGAHD